MKNVKYLLIEAVKEFASKGRLNAPFCFQEIQCGGKEQQEMVVGCQRLIQNTIVLGNELFYSQELVN
ncbi:Uncharacterised protein [Legionella sainthelensi]|uniref:hypothetical protein n=1 Tax=Legionella sainthelensi TaxID=28087 RepID=UPI000F6CCB2A|nr:hypothetical protein [Legionella sainthelensi]VEB32272.1 Uncharacterised protein [Legionella sainthelensi]